MQPRYLLYLILPATFLIGCNNKCTKKCSSYAGRLIAVGYNLAELDSVRVYRYPKGTTTTAAIDSLTWASINTTQDTLMANLYDISDQFDYMISGPHLSRNYTITNIASGGGDQYSTEYCDDMDNACNNPPYMNAYTINNQDITITSRAYSYVCIVK